MTEQLQLGADTPPSALFCRPLRLAVRTAPKPTSVNLLRSIRDRWYLRLPRNRYWAPHCQFVVMITQTPARRYLHSVNQRRDGPKTNNHRLVSTPNFCRIPLKKWERTSEQQKYHFIFLVWMKAWCLCSHQSTQRQSTLFFSVMVLVYVGGGCSVHVVHSES